MKQRIQGMVLWCSLFVLLLGAVVMFTACGGSGSRLSGTWGLQNDNPDRVPCTIVFSGNNFTLTRFSVWIGPYTQGHQVNTMPLSLSCNDASWESGWDVLAKLPPMQNVFDAECEVIRGRYSISDNGDEIEFICECGRITVFDFSRTENTITIGRTQLVRR